MFPKQTSIFTLPKIINGLSKTLSVASKIVPIYEQSKPLLNGAKSAVKKLQNIKTIPVKTNIKKNDTKKVIKTDNHFNNPSFFQ